MPFDTLRMAVDISQTTTERSLYIDDRLLFVEVAQGLGINGIHHRSYELSSVQMIFLFVFAVPPALADRTHSGRSLPGGAAEA